MKWFLIFPEDPWLHHHFNAFVKDVIFSFGNLIWHSSVRLRLGSSLLWKHSNTVTGSATRGGGAFPGVDPGQRSDPCSRLLEAPLHFGGVEARVAELHVRRLGHAGTLRPIPPTFSTKCGAVLNFAACVTVNLLWLTDTWLIWYVHVLPRSLYGASQWIWNLKSDSLIRW